VRLWPILLTKLGLLPIASGFFQLFADLGQHGHNIHQRTGPGDDTDPIH
jgi:hypothetical protein